MDRYLTAERLALLVNASVGNRHFDDDVKLTGDEYDLINALQKMILSVVYESQRNHDED